MWRFLLLFLLIQFALFAVEMLDPVQAAVIMPWTGVLADVSAWLLQLFDDNVIAQANLLRDKGSGFAVAIAPGCNGVEAMIVLLAAILAFPAPWLHRLKGVMYGFLAIQGLNLLRIISLYYLGQWNQEVFDWAHNYAWQAMIMLDALIVFLIWIRMMPGRRPAEGAADGQG